jgi:transmembrane 9 superfamily protein 2/4
MIALVALWFGVSVPLVFFGSFIGFKRKKIGNPVDYNMVPSMIKEQPWYLGTFFSCAVGGLLPFGGFFIELQFLMISIWEHSFYYLFGFMFIVLLIIMLMCAEVAILFVYV